MFTKKGKRTPVSVYFNEDDRADQELLDWLNEQTNNKNAYIKKVLFHHMKSEQQAIHLYINNNIGSVPVTAREPEKEESKEVEVDKEKIQNSGLPIDDDDE